MTSLKQLQQAGKATEEIIEELVLEGYSYRIGNGTGLTVMSGCGGAKNYIRVAMSIGTSLEDALRDVWVVPDNGDEEVRLTETITYLRY